MLRPLIIAILTVLTVSIEPSLVEILSHKDFQQVTGIDISAKQISATKDTWFIFLMAPWCKYCKQTLPIWLQLAQQLRESSSSVKLGLLDCEQNPMLCGGILQVYSFPRFLLFSKDGTYLYEQQREASHMKEYIEGKYKLTTKIVIKQPSVFELVTQFVEKIGWITIFLGTLIISWLAYLCSGLFLKGFQDKIPVPACIKKSSHEKQN